MYIYVTPQEQMLLLKIFSRRTVLIYRSPTNTMVIWGSGDFPQKNFLEANCLQCQKIPLQKIGGMERVQHEGQFLPLLPPHG